ncbi:hypothetical protein Patl1_24663 [Pistacia atlantica]|uniref:Uncharacterized protein n=1 Tax=Pistacia atlantica TaxID=434234 RepID=A0ACC0ZZL3_9ROSI|nr:hypothetical protein Patl1_24663 [Pistacia atlantica]
MPEFSVLLHTKCASGLIFFVILIVVDLKVCGILEENARDRDSNDQRHESRSPSFAQGSVLVPRNASPFLKLGLITMGKDTTSSSWLSLNSCAPGHPARTKHKNTGGTISEAPSAKDIASPANRSFKKTTPTMKKVAEQKDATVVAQQLSLSPTVGSQGSVHCQTRTSLNIGTTMRTSTVRLNEAVGVPCTGFCCHLSQLANE